MSLFKCKMCGGTIEFEEGSSVGVCDSCGTKQTLPRLDTERKANLYDRADHFRRSNDFDKAAGIFEQILNEDPTDAEAYWSLVLCRYGIEYVEDPSSHKRVPTVNRAQFISIFDDEDYKSALQHADIYQRALYEEEANTINEIQKGILAISQNEDPFDIFICYKETDNNGRRTPDSVLANDLYYQLVQEGFKVFFSRITLEDKLGTAYEPYIFAALNSAKVMVVLGTKPEYFNAVWVKNEWSRYLTLVKQSYGKKVLIPAYRDMDPYDLPEEFSHLQAQDMSKLGFMQDLIRGIKKITQVEESKSTTAKSVGVSTNETSTAPLLRRAFIFLEDGEWNRADEVLEQVLNQDPENAQAYIGKLMVELHVVRQDDLKNCEETFDNSNNYIRAIRYGDDSVAAQLKGYVSFIENRNKDSVYQYALSKMENADTEDAYKEAASEFLSIQNYKDSNALASKCIELAEDSRKYEIYKKAICIMNDANDENDYNKAAGLFRTIPGFTKSDIQDFNSSDTMVEICDRLAGECKKERIYQEAVERASGNNESDTLAIDKLRTSIDKFRMITGYKDADVLIIQYEKRINEIQEKIEADRLEREQKKEQERIAEEKTQKRKRLIRMIVSGAMLFCVALVFLINYISDSIEEKRQLSDISDYGVVVGSTIKLGHRNLDSNLFNGKEEIQWLVLDVQGNSALLISKYALYNAQYNPDHTGITWETCSLRQMLNRGFLNGSFGKSIQDIIIETHVVSEDNPNYGTSGGNDTTDKVFLLSIEEARQYFVIDSERRCTYLSGENCWWWLRSPGCRSDYAACVRKNGDFDDYAYVYYDGGAVRPVMWIKLEE